MASPQMAYVVDGVELDRQRVAAIDPRLSNACGSLEYVTARMFAALQAAVPYTRRFVEKASKLYDMTNEVFEETQLARDFANANAVLSSVLPYYLNVFASASDVTKHRTIVSTLHDIKSVIHTSDITMYLTADAIELKRLRKMALAQLQCVIDSVFAVVAAKHALNALRTNLDFDTKDKERRIREKTTLEDALLTAVEKYWDVKFSDADRPGDWDNIANMDPEHNVTKEIVEETFRRTRNSGGKGTVLNAMTTIHEDWYAGPDSESETNRATRLAVINDLHNVEREAIARFERAGDIMWHALHTMNNPGGVEAGDVSTDHGRDLAVKFSHSRMWEHDRKLYVSHAETLRTALTHVASNARKLAWFLSLRDFASDGIVDHILPFWCRMRADSPDDACKLLAVINARRNNSNIEWDRLFIRAENTIRLRIKISTDAVLRFGHVFKMKHPGDAFGELSDAQNLAQSVRIWQFFWFEFFGIHATRDRIRALLEMPTTVKERTEEDMRRFMQSATDARHKACVFDFATWLRKNIPIGGIENLRQIETTVSSDDADTDSDAVVAQIGDVAYSVRGEYMGLSAKVTTNGRIGRPESGRLDERKRDTIQFFRQSDNPIWIFPSASVTTPLRVAKTEEERVSGRVRIAERALERALFDAPTEETTFVRREEPKELRSSTPWDMRLWRDFHTLAHDQQIPIPDERELMKGEDRNQPFFDCIEVDAVRPQSFHNDIDVDARMIATIPRREIDEVYTVMRTNKHRVDDGNKEFERTPWPGEWGRAQRDTQPFKDPAFLSSEDKGRLLRTISEGIVSTPSSLFSSFVSTDVNLKNADSLIRDPVTKPVEREVGAGAALIGQANVHEASVMFHHLMRDLNGNARGGHFATRTISDRKNTAAPVVPHLTREADGSIHNAKGRKTPVPHDALLRMLRLQPMIIRATPPFGADGTRSHQVIKSYRNKGKLTKITFCGNVPITGNTVSTHTDRIVVDGGGAGADHDALTMQRTKALGDPTTRSHSICEVFVNDADHVRIDLAAVEGRDGALAGAIAGVMNVAWNIDRIAQKARHALGQGELSGAAWRAYKHTEWNLRAAEHFLCVKALERERDADLFWAMSLRTLTADSSAMSDLAESERALICGYLRSWACRKTLDAKQFWRAAPHLEYANARIKNILDKSAAEIASFRTAVNERVRQTGADTRKERLAAVRGAFEAEGERTHKQVVTMRTARSLSEIHVSLQCLLTRGAALSRAVPPKSTPGKATDVSMDRIIALIREKREEIQRIDAGSLSDLPRNTHTEMGDFVQLRRTFEPQQLAEQIATLHDRFQDTFRRVPFIVAALSAFVIDLDVTESTTVASNGIEQTFVTMDTRVGKLLAHERV